MPRRGRYLHATTYSAFAHTFSRAIFPAGVLGRRAEWSTVHFKIGAQDVSRNLKLVRLKPPRHISTSYGWIMLTNVFCIIAPASSCLANPFRSRLSSAPYATCIPPGLGRALAASARGRVALGVLTDSASARDPVHAQDSRASYSHHSSPHRDSRNKPCLCPLPRWLR